MSLKLAQFFSIVLTAFIFAPGAAHLFALPNKIGLSAADYFTVQGAYRGWALFGAVIFAAMACDVWLVIALGGQGLRQGIAFGALVALALTILIFFLLVFPGNQATANWTEIPPNWRQLRTRWEYGHAASAIVTFIALCLVTGAALMPPRGP